LSQITCGAGLSLVTDFAFGVKSLPNTIINLNVKFYKGCLYVFVTLTLLVAIYLPKYFNRSMLATKLTQLFSLTRLTYYSAKLLNVQNHDVFFTKNPYFVTVKIFNVV